MTLSRFQSGDCLLHGWRHWSSVTLLMSLISFVKPSFLFMGAIFDMLEVPCVVQERCGTIGNLNRVNCGRVNCAFTAKVFDQGVPPPFWRCLLA
jgi:hypothetical protein